MSVCGLETNVSSELLHSELNASKNLVPPSDDEDVAEFEYLTGNTPVKQSISSSQSLRDHCKEHERKLAAEALKHVSKFMAHTYRLNRDAISPKDFPQPTFAQFIAYTKVCTFPAENIVSSSTSSAFSPVLQRYDSYGNYYPSPVPTTIPETVSQSFAVSSESASGTLLDNSNAIKPEQDAQPLTKSMLDSVMFVPNSSPDEAICISDEDDTQELVNKLMTPGMNNLLKPKCAPQPEETTPTPSDPHTIVHSIAESPPRNSENRRTSLRLVHTLKTSSTAQKPNRKLFADVNTNSTPLPTNSSSNNNFSDETQPIRLPPKPPTPNKPSSTSKPNESLRVQVNPTASAANPIVPPHVYQVVSDAKITHTIPIHGSHHSLFPARPHRQMYLKLATFVAASFHFVSSTDRMQTSVRFAHRSDCVELNEESTRMLLQLHNGDNVWMAVRSILHKHRNYKYAATESAKQIRRRSLGERILHLLFKSRNSVRDGLVVVAHESLGERSLICSYPQLSVGSGSLDKSLCPEIRNCLRQRRLGLGLV